MARPRKPTSVLELNGAYKKDPQRRASRLNEPKPTGPLGEPPSRLSAREASAWREIAALLPPGVAGNSHRLAFEHLARLAAKMFEDGVGGKYGLTNGEQTALLQLYGRFGLTPSDQTRISVKQADQEDNPFSDIAAEGAAVHFKDATVISARPKLSC